MVPDPEMCACAAVHAPYLVERRGRLGMERWNLGPLLKAPVIPVVVPTISWPGQEYV